MAKIVEWAAGTYVQRGRPLSQDTVRSEVPASQAVSEEAQGIESRKRAEVMGWSTHARDRSRFMSGKTTLVALWRGD